MLVLELIEMPQLIDEMLQVTRKLCIFFLVKLIEIEVALADEIVLMFYEVDAF